MEAVGMTYACTMVVVKKRNVMMVRDHSATKPRGVCLRPADQMARRATEAKRSRHAVESQSAAVWKARLRIGRRREVRETWRQRSRKTCCISPPKRRRNGLG